MQRVYDMGQAFTDGNGTRTTNRKVRREKENDGCEV